jgi:hypothetical protein
MGEDSDEEGGATEEDYEDPFWCASQGLDPGQSLKLFSQRKMCWL